jgi:molecular chaperone HscB
LDLSQSYFELFELPASYRVDAEQLSSRYRNLQQALHPDRYASGSPQEQRLAVQYSSLVNEAYTTLRDPLRRALYLLAEAGIDEAEVARQQVDGGFLIQQMELREKLESFHDLLDPDTVLSHLLDEIETDIRALQTTLGEALDAGKLDDAAVTVVKMQYLDKLHSEAQLLESALLDS